MAAASVLLWWKLPRTEDTIESRKRFVSKTHKRIEIIMKGRNLFH